MICLKLPLSVKISDETETGSHYYNYITPETRLTVSLETVLSRAQASLYGVLADSDTSVRNNAFMCKLQCANYLHIVRTVELLFIMTVVGWPGCLLVHSIIRLAPITQHNVAGNDEKTRPD